MTFSSLILQMLNGLAGASSLFLVAAGLSLIFGVSRIVNFAHGSFYMVGIYIGGSLIAFLPQGILGFWGGVALAAVAVGLLGLVVEMALLRRIYRAPELLQLLATFGVVLLIKDGALWLWGPEDLLGPRAPGLAGAVMLLGRSVPQYDLLLIFIGPAVLIALSLLLGRTRWGVLVRAATEDRDMVGALGVNQAWLFSSVFFLGALLAGLGGAVQIPREPANLGLDLTAISDAFVVVVVGGMGSIPGAFLAALLIAEVKALCIGIGTLHLGPLTLSLSKATLVIEFVVMAIVLVVRPYGLLGRPGAEPRPLVEENGLRPPGMAGKAALVGLFAVLALLPAVTDTYTLVLLVDIFIFALFAASLHFLMGPGGMTSFGHAAYFGLGAYGAALLLKSAGLPMEGSLLLSPLVAGLGGLLFGWFCVRLSGVYLAMLTLAFAQIAWSTVFQWDDFTGGSNGLIGIWPAHWLTDRTAFYYLALVLCGGGVLALRRVIFSPFGYALRAGRDSPVRTEAIGIDLRRQQWFGFALAAVFAGLAGGLYAFSKGSISPESMGIGRSVDGLVMVLMGGVGTLAGPLVGAGVFTWLQDFIIRHTDYWQAVLGLVIILLVLVFPQGIAGVRLPARQRGGDGEAAP